LNVKNLFISTLMSVVKGTEKRTVRYQFPVVSTSIHLYGSH